MKLSELSTERATDVLCEIAPYFMNITTDEELVIATDTFRLTGK
jgi:acetate kinase